LSAVACAIKILDWAWDQGHFVDSEDIGDSQMLKYLRFTRAVRPASSDMSARDRRPLSSSRFARSVTFIESIAENVTEIQTLMAQEHIRMQTEIANM
jgi:hypothetical protein